MIAQTLSVVEVESLRCCHYTDSAVIKLIIGTLNGLSIYEFQVYVSRKLHVTLKDVNVESNKEKW